MADVIPFPTKSTFLDNFPSNLPKDIAAELAVAYDRASAIGSEFGALRESHQIRPFVLKMMTRILELEADVILARRGL